jgi:GT2 family glycosyltransferase
MTRRINESATDIIIPVYNQYSFTRNLIESVYRHTDAPFHLYVIDNASTDETADLDKIFTRNITVVHNRKNLNWCGGINQGLQLGANPNVVFMNNEVEVSRGWLENLLAFLDTHPRIGAVGPLNSDANDAHNIDRVRGTVVPQIPGFLTDDLHEMNKILKYHFDRAGITTESILALFCVALKRRTVNEVGLLDERYRAGKSDKDYCRRLRKAGYVLGLSLDTYVIHHSGLAAKTLFDSSRARPMAQ